MKKILLFSLIFAANVFGQSITISEGALNPAASNESGNGKNIVMLQLQLDAGSDEDVVVTSLRLTPTSSGFRTDEIEGPDIRIYNDVNNNGILETDIDEFIASGNYAGNAWNPPSASTLTIPDYVIPASGTQNWLIMNSFVNGDASDYIEVAVSQNSDVVAEGYTSSSPATITGAAVNGNRKTVTATTSAGALFIGAGGNNTISRNIEDGAQDEVMLQVSLTASTLENIDITDITFDMSGTGDESNDLIRARLYNDIDGDGQLNESMDTQIGSSIFSFTNDGQLQFSSLSETVTAGTSEDWIVVYDYDGSQTAPPDNFQTTLTNNTDITATGGSSSLSITPSGAPVAGGLSTVSAIGTLVLSAGSNNPLATTISSDASNISMLQLNMSAGSTEDVNISAITFTTTGSGDESADLDSVRLFQDVNGNGAYDLGIDLQIGSTLTSFTDDGDLVFSSLSEQVSAGASEDWLVVYYFNGTASSTETFRASLDQNSDMTATGDGSGSGITPTGSPVYGNDKSISSTGTLTMAIGPNNAGAENVDGTSQNIVMMQLQLQASAVEDIQINSLSLTTGGSGFRNDEVVSPDIRIYRDMNNNGVFDTGIDELIITQNYVGNAWNFPGNTTINLTNRYIYAGATENWLIVNNFVNGDLGDNLELSLVNNSDISATGVTSSQSVNVNGATLNGGAKTVVNGTTPGTLSMALGPNDPGFQNILPGATNKSMIDLQTISLFRGH